MLFYFWQSVVYANTTSSGLDEGLYLYKGYMYAKGEYIPFAPNQFWTNKGPLSFLIPGYMQLLFGPGLRTGRYLSIFLGVLMVFGVWMAARQMGSKWLAVVAIWVMALRPVSIEYYSQGISQVLVAVMMSWMLVCSLGKDRSLWQVIVSGFLAGCMIMTRQNMVLVLPILIWYVWWQHGLKPAFYAGLAGASVVFLFHALYWPNILQLWAPWLPGSVSPFLDPFRVPSDGEIVKRTTFSNLSRLLSATQGIRDNFFPFIGGLIGITLLSTEPSWKKNPNYRSAVFLGILFIVLTAMHFWASILNNSCIFCFSPYLSFFRSAGILFVIVMIRMWDGVPGTFRWIIVALITLMSFSMVGYSMFETLGKPLMNINIPDVSIGDKTWLSSTTFGELISSLFNLELSTARQILPLLAGTGVGILLSLVSLAFRRRINATLLLAHLTLILGVVLPFPTVFISDYNTRCDINVLDAYEENGSYLAGIVPPGSLIYWAGGSSVAPLLYMPGVDVFPAQLNQVNSFRKGGDPVELLKFGLWNDILAEQWKSKADFVLVEERFYSSWKDILTPQEFDEFPRTGKLSCSENSRIRIFRRKL
jgi:4-amino-4-deoxy-L-arabinose transferase-like glycosyltransferase